MDLEPGLGGVLMRPGVTLQLLDPGEVGGGQGGPLWWSWGSQCTELLCVKGLGETQSSSYLSVNIGWLLIATWNYFKILMISGVRMVSTVNKYLGVYLRVDQQVVESDCSTLIGHNNRSFSKSLIPTDISSSRKHQVDPHPCQHLALSKFLFFFLPIQM